jgi:hypothetical protein
VTAARSAVKRLRAVARSCRTALGAALRASALAAACALAACGGSVKPVNSCAGPADCGGDPCCYEVTPVQSNGQISCGNSASSCVPEQGVDTFTTRLCTTDADCTAGGVSTQLATCCPNTIQGKNVHTCAKSCT